MNEIALRFNGAVPSKKNAWKRGRNGMFIDEETKQIIFAITLAFTTQWKLQGQYEPLSRPPFWFTLDFTLGVTHHRQDSDNMVTTLLDCLQKAGVLRNDNTKHLRRWSVEVEEATEPYARVLVRWRKAASKRKVAA